MIECSRRKADIKKLVEVGLKGSDYSNEISSLRFKSVKLHI
jgi:hypothetical protein